MTQLVIIGAGGFGREVLDIVVAINDLRPTFDFLGFLDDGAVDESLLVRRDTKLIGAVDALETLDAAYLIAIGSPQARKTIDTLVSTWGRTAATAVHPSATIGGDVALGAGAIVAAGTRLTTNIAAGRHLIVNLNATIGHDVVIGDYVTIAPGATISGAVTLGHQVDIGTGVSIVPGVEIGPGSVIGAGAAVIGDLPGGVTAVGVPARPLNR